MNTVENGGINLVYGESENQGRLASKDRHYKLGNDYIKEKRDYNHLGLKTVFQIIMIIGLKIKLQKEEKPFLLQ